MELPLSYVEKGLVRIVREDTSIYKKLKASKRFREMESRINQQYRGYYEGSSSFYNSKDKAFKEALFNAIERFYVEELGVVLEKGERLEKVEKNGRLSVSYRSTVSAKTHVAEVRPEVKQEFYEKKDGKYRAFVSIYISPDEIERAKREVKELKESIKEFALREFEKGEKNFEKGFFQPALLHYETVLKLLEEFPGLLEDKLRASSARVKAIKNYKEPEFELLSLKGKAGYFSNVSLIKNGSKTFSKDGIFYINPGDRFRLNISLNRPSFLYLFSYWYDAKEVRLLHPNFYEKEGKFSEKFIFPQKVELVAEPPPGMNYLLLLATSSPLKIETFIKFHPNAPAVLSRDVTSRILKTLKGKDYDIKKIGIFIR